MAQFSKTLKASVLLAVAMVIARLLSGIAQIIMAGYFGTSRSLDAYLVAVAVPNVLSEWLLLATPSVVLIPVLLELRNNNREKEAWDIACSFTNLIILLMVVLAAFVFLTGPLFISMLAPGFDESTNKLSTTILKIILIILPITAISGMFRAILHSHHRFLPYALVLIVNSAIIIIAVSTLSRSIAVFSIVIGYSLGAVVSLAIFFVASKNMRYRYRFSLNLLSPFAKQSVKLLVAFAIIGGSAQINFLADRFFASFLASGSISVFEYSEKLASFLMIMFAASVALPSYSIFASHMADDNLAKTREAVISSIKLIALVTLPIFVWSLILRVPLIRLFLEHGNFNERDTASVSVVFTYLLGVWLIYAFAQILMYAFFALRDTNRFVLIVVFGIILNIGLDIILVRSFQVAGLAMATLFAAIISNSLSWLLLSSKLKISRDKKLWRFLGTVCLSSGFSGLAVTASVRWLNTFYSTQILVSQIMYLSIVGTIGVITYLIANLILKNEVVYEILSAIKTRF